MESFQSLLTIRQRAARCCRTGTLTCKKCRAPGKVCLSEIRAGYDPGPGLRSRRRVGSLQVSCCVKLCYFHDLIGFRCYFPQFFFTFWSVFAVFLGLSLFPMSCQTCVIASPAPPPLCRQAPIFLHLLSARYAPHVPLPCVFFCPRSVLSDVSLTPKRSSCSVGS